MSVWYACMICMQDMYAVYVCKICMQDMYTTIMCMMSSNYYNINHHITIYYHKIDRQSSGEEGSTNMSCLDSCTIDTFVP